jgi:hypothetical protein
MENYTYIITADNCMNPKITVRYEGLTEKQVLLAIRCFYGAFRSIEVICSDTGEVMYNHYVSEDFMIYTKSEAEALDELSDCLKLIKD